MGGDKAIIFRFYTALDWIVLEPVSCPDIWQEKGKAWKSKHFFQMTEPQTAINLDFYFGLSSLSVLDLDKIPPSIKGKDWEASKAT